MMKSSIGRIIILPFQGAGNIKFGMTREEVESILIPISKEKYVKELDVSFIQYSSSKAYSCIEFLICFKNNKVCEITLYDGLRECHNIPVLLYDIDVFSEKAEDVINKLESYATCICDKEDKDLSTEYVFLSLGAALWREDGFHTKLLSSQAFNEMSPDDQDFKKRNCYFQTMTIFGSIEEAEFHLSLW